MSLFDVLLGAIRINDDDDYDDDEYNEDDDLDEDDEEDEDFEDERPKKLFNMKFRRKSGSKDYEDGEEDEEDPDDEDLDEEEDEEEEKPRKSFFFFRGKKASRDIEDDEDEEDDEEEEEEEEPPRASRKRRKRDRNAGRSRTKQERAPREATTSYRSTQSSYTSSGAAFTGSTYNSETTDWSSMLREKPVKNSRNNQRKRSTGSRARVEVIRPKSMEETQDIAETLMNNSTVILNLEITDVETSQRIIDFSCGVCYALNGGLKQVANYFYILTPENVEISGDYTNMLNGDFDFPSIRSQY